MFSLIERWLRSLNLRSKLFISIIITALIPLFAVIVTLYSYLSRSLGEQVEYAARTSLTQTRDYLAYQASEVVALTDTLIFTPSMQRILARSPEESAQNVVQQYNDATDMSRLFSSMTAGRRIARVRLYVQSDLIYSQENVNFFDYGKVSEKEWVKRMFERSQKIFWYSPQELDDGLNMIAACRPIKNYADFNKYWGILRIDLEEDMIAEVVRRAQSTPGATALLVTVSGAVVAPGELPAEDAHVLSQWAWENVTAGEAVWAYDTVFSTRHLLGVIDVPNTNWLLVCAIPSSDILAPSRELVRPLTLTTLLCAVIMTLIALLFSWNITKRVDDLLGEMALLESGEFDFPAPDVQWRDDIGILTYQFHRMREQLHKSMREKTEALEGLRRSEVRALQAQINPHFLYNTLDFIHWGALDYNAHDLADAVLALSRFYRMSLGGGHDLVPLSQEVDHADTYLRILNARYEQKIILDVNVTSEAMSVSVPRITLQPLVENAVHHGLLPLLNDGAIDNGHVEISGTLGEGILTVWIRDNGAGIDEEMRAKLFGDTLRNMQTGTGGGYSLGNIKDRINTLYGGNATIEVTSRIGAGTEVMLRIPIDAAETEKGSNSKPS